MPRTVENIGFYSRLGFRPGHLTVTRQHDNPVGASAERLPTGSLRAPTSLHCDLYSRLVEKGFRVHWTDLRMTLAGKEAVERSGVLLSNWEI